LRMRLRRAREATAFTERGMLNEFRV